MAAFLFVALTVPGFVLAVRALPWVDEKVLAGIKPWACDICMSFWSTILWALVALPIFGVEALVSAPPAYTVALGLLTFLSRPPSVGPDLDLPGDP